MKATKFQFQKSEELRLLGIEGKEEDRITQRETLNLCPNCNVEIAI